MGVLIGSTSTRHVTPLTYENLVSGVERAEALPWDRIAGVVSHAGHDEPKELNDDFGLYATATGPLAGVLVGYGVPVALRAPGEEWKWNIDEKQRFLDDPTTVAATIPGLALVGGNTTNQTPQSAAVYGVEVAKAFYDGLPPVAVDVSAAAHVGRVRQLGELSDQSAYHLIAHFD